jgi:hypothetical protein
MFILFSQKCLPENPCMEDSSIGDYIASQRLSKISIERSEEG